MDFTTVIGISASVFTALSMLPQLIKIIKEKNARGTSPLMLISLGIGVSCWVWYGCLIDDLIIVISNGFSLLVTLITGILVIRYRATLNKTEKSVLIGKL